MKLKTLILKSSLRDYSVAYVLVSGTTTVAELVVFKNFC